MPGLRYLDLNGRQGTDANIWAISMSQTGLDAILSLKELRELHFGCTSLGVGVEGSRFATVSAINVTTLWLQKMKSLTKLEKLKLQGCSQVDDESLAVLATFPVLREVDLKGTSVTEKGLALFRAAKPKAVIYTGPWEAKAAAFRNN
jgi:hypothetical protein